MANVTISIDEKLLRKGRDYAASRGTSLNALLRAHLLDLTSESDTEIAGIILRLRSSQGNSHRNPFKRQDLYDGRI